MRQPPIPSRRPVGARIFTRVWLLVASALTAGCGIGLPPFQSAPTTCTPPDDPRIHLVLTFDDGPFPADLRFNADDSPDAILASLDQILAVLERRQARAVFYIAVHVAEPADDDIVIRRADVFARGIQSIHDAGHVLGYHAFDHAGQIWANPIPLRALSVARMVADLAKLQAYIDFALAPTPLSRDNLFAPIFRQPFGGDGVCAGAGRAAALQMGWSIHGCRIDSGDWTENLNSDPAVLRRLHVATPDDELNFVRARLRNHLDAAGQRDILDVQFHVNSLTAANLDEWIDTLQQEIAAQSGAPPILDVPDCYLTHSDPYLDPAIFRSMVRPPPP